MGLKDVVERIAGKKPTKQRGARGPRQAKRDRDESTIQVPVGGVGWPASGPSQAPPQAPQAPPQASHVPPQAPHNPPQALAPRQAPAPRPAAPAAAPQQPPAYVPPTSPPAAAPRRGAAQSASAEATQYVTVPGMGAGDLVGVLVGIDGELKGEVLRIFDGDNKVGRAQECDVHLLDPKVSREHATIASEDGVQLILPISKKNPVFVNDEAVEDCDELADGDKVRFGNPGSSTFRFRTIEGP